MWKVMVLMAALLAYSGGGSETPADGTPADGTGMPPAIVHAAAQAEPAHRDSLARSYGSLNGISLTDRKQDVIRKLGRPAGVDRDAIGGLTVFHYQDMEVGIRQGFTEYVRVKPSANDFRVENLKVGMTAGEVRASLGKPYFEAEDGDVYLRNHDALKVFLNRETGEITGIDLFFDYSE